MTTHNEHIAQIFQAKGILPSEELNAALSQATEQTKSLLHVLTERGQPTAELFAVLATHYGMETVSLTDSNPSPTAAQLIPEEIARRYQTVPLAKTDGTLTLAFGDPLDLETMDALRYYFQESLKIIAALPEQIAASLRRLYPDQHESSSQEQAPEYELIETATDQDNEPIIKLVNMLIAEGFKQRASDIHLEPLPQQFRVRYRIDGALREVEGPPRRLHPSVISRIKIMSGMKISEKRLPQDGRIEIQIMDRSLDLRVSSIPTNHGESIVMRILDKQNLLLGLPNLGFYSDDQQSFERLIQYPDGINLITGPTGSGKTTSLYACLNYLNNPNRKIITVEDPVEYQLSGINQVHVNSDIGLTFSTALRSILRQAPNLIMIGEIRDQETAEIAVNAALTGHLVLSTLHTNDAPSAVTRLEDIGVKPFLISSSVRGIMAQRLARSICRKCQITYSPSAAELSLLGSVAELYRGEGCSACGGTGYLGRKGIFELLSINDDLRQMIYAGATSTELRKEARKLGMRSLREDGLRKATDGITTVNEVLRVTMRDES